MFLTKEDLEKTETNHFSGKMFKDKQNRTLMLGYNLDRSTVHIYLEDGELCIVCYDPNGSFRYSDKGDFEELHSIIPSKRAYPESTDKEFFEILKNHDVSVSFTPFNEHRESSLARKHYHGWTMKNILDGLNKLKFN